MKRALTFSRAIQAVVVAITIASFQFASHTSAAPIQNAMEPSPLIMSSGTNLDDSAESMWGYSVVRKDDVAILKCTTAALKAKNIHITVTVTSRVAELSGLVACWQKGPASFTALGCGASRVVNKLKEPSTGCDRLKH